MAKRKTRTRQPTTKEVGKRSDPEYTTRAYLLRRNLVRQLDALAAVTDKDRSELVNEALSQYVKKHRGKLRVLLDD